jgi:hypothetical protein
MIAFFLAMTLGVAQAGTLYVNGTPVDGLKNHDFNQVDVRIDGKGDIYIHAPGANVLLGKDAKGKQQVGGKPAPTKESDLPRGSWWLVSEDQGSSGHKVEVMINGVAVKTVESGGRQIIFDISPYLHTGTNVITFRNQGADTPGGAALEIMIGTGSIVGNKVSTDRPKLIYKRNSASVGGSSDDSKTLVID